MRETTEELFQAWKDHQVTKDLILWASNKREALKEGWAQGDFTAAFDIEMMAKNAGATGAASILKQIMDLNYDDFYAELSDE